MIKTILLALLLPLHAFASSAVNFDSSGTFQITAIN